MKALYILVSLVVLSLIIWLSYIFYNWCIACAICGGRKITWKLFRTMYAIAPERWAICPCKFNPFSSAHYFDDCVPRLNVAYWEELPRYFDYESAFGAENIRFSFFDTIRFYFWVKARQAKEDKAEKIVMDAKTKEDLAKLYLSFQKDIDCYIKKHHAEVV